MIDAAKNLKMISTYGVGFDHVDVGYAKEKGIVVSNCPKSVLRPTAELTLTMIMASARRLRYYDHALREGAFLDAKLEEELNAKYVDFDILVKEADFLSLHAPATDETYHIINADVFEQMKETAYLINVARGSLVDSDALIAALKKGEIAGAALDVFENEPHPRQELVNMDNVIMTPHVGSATHIARYNLSKEAANNVLPFFKDGKAINKVNQ